MKILILPFNRWTRHRVVAGSFVCARKGGKIGKYIVMEP